MNASICCLGLGMIALFFATMIFIRENNKKIAKLKKELNEAIETIDFLNKDLLSMDDDISNNSKELNDIKKNFSSLDKGLELTLTSHLKGIEGSLKGMLDIAEQEHADALKWRSEACDGQIKALCDAGDDDEPYADIPGDLDEGFEGEEPATDEQREALEYANKKVQAKTNYKWIFPSEDPASTPIPIVGDEYLVIGSDMSYTGFKEDLVSGVGVWKGLGSKPWSCGFDMDEGYKLDKVYAYVRLPSPSDVMEKILDIRSKEE